MNTVILFYICRVLLKLFLGPLSITRLSYNSSDNFVVPLTNYANLFGRNSTPNAPGRAYKRIKVSVFCRILIPVKIVYIKYYRI